MFKKKIKFDEYDLSENDYNLLMKTYEGNLNDFLAEKNSTIESFTIHFENQRLEKELNKQKTAAQTADNSILEQKIKELEAENAELLEKNKKLSKEKEDDLKTIIELHENNTEMYNYVQNLKKNFAYMEETE